MHANVKYVNTYACVTYLRKIFVVCISVYGRSSQICGTQLSSILCKYVMHANALTYFTFAVTYAVNKYLFKYLNMLKLIHMCTFCIHRGLLWSVCAHVGKSGFGLSDLIRPYKVVINLPACKLFYQQELIDKAPGLLMSRRQPYKV